MSKELAKKEEKDSNTEIANYIGKEIDVVKNKALYDFNVKFQKQPLPQWIKKNNGVNYIPIRIIEQLLRTVFGAYQIEFAAPPSIIGNSVVCSVHLKVYHPILKEWLSYAGIGAVPVQLAAKEMWGVDEKGNKGKIPNPDGARHALDFERINPMALHKNIPAAKSFAVNNAAKQLGNIFGATINADDNEIISVIDTYREDRKVANEGLDNLVNGEG